MRQGSCVVGEKEDNEIPPGPLWLTSPTFWFRMLFLAIGLVAIRYFINGGFV